MIMIAFGPPHDPNSPEGREYAAVVERIKKMRREVEEQRQKILREMEKTMPLVNQYAGGNPFAFMFGFIAFCSIPGILMLIILNALNKMID